MQNNVAENVDGMQMQIPMRTELVELKERSLLKKEDVYLGFKRTSDVVISAIALVALSPIMLFAAAAVKLDSKGPAFLVQERIGQDGKIFKMYKYRSMVVGADAILEKYLAENEEARKEYQTYKKLKDEIQNNPEKKQKVEEFEKLRYEIQLIAYTGEEKNEEKTKKLEEMYATLIENKDIKEYFDLEVKFNVMIADINKIIAESIKDVL